MQRPPWTRAPRDEHCMSLPEGQESVVRAFFASFAAERRGVGLSELQSYRASWSYVSLPRQTHLRSLR